MANPLPTIDNSYEQFYAKRARLKVYPTEFVVRTLLANYPGLGFRKPKAGDRVLDIAFGDGRNTVFLCDQGYAVSGIEITEGIVRQTGERKFCGKHGFSPLIHVNVQVRAGHGDAAPDRSG